MSHRPWNQPWPGGGGSGGGSTAWADITGKPTEFAPSAHGHAVADVTGLQSALDGKQDVGSGALAGLATVTVPVNALQHTQTVTATGVTGASIVIAVIAPHADSDENDAEFLDVAALSASPGADEITFDLSFLTPTQGPIKLNWSAF